MYFIKPTDPYPISTGKALMLCLLCLVWLATGLVGHDPWKPDEAYSFGLVHSMVQDGHWLVPTLAGEPFMDKPPLYYWTAAVCSQLFSGFLPAHDGARLASGYFSALTLLFIGLCGRKLYGENRGWATAIILIGCLGMLVHAHQIVTDLALLSGCAMMLYGYSHSQERPYFAGIWLGLGMGAGFMSKGFIAPVFFILIAACLPALFKAWRGRNFAFSVGIALLVALPWLTLWPLLLFLHSPALFHEWLWTDNIGRWLQYASHGPTAESFYYLQNLPWLAWPAWPLAAWVVWKSRHRLGQRDDLQLPLVSFAAMLAALSLVPNIEEVFSLPLLLPISLLAAASLSTLKRGAANALDWFGLMLFALLAIAMWWGWGGLLLDNQAKITHWLKDYQPSFVPELDDAAAVIALVSTALWLILVWRVGRSMRRAVVNWAAGITLVWILAMSLWLPWLDSGKSYRKMVVALKHALPVSYTCIRRENLGNGQRAMLYYFGDILTREDPSHRCDLRLIQGRKTPGTGPDSAHWEKIWEGSRMDDKSEQYRLYRRRI